MLEILSPEELYERGELERHELKSPRFADKTVMKFDSLDEATEFGKGFLIGYFLPRYGLEETKKFPFVKSGPFRNVEDYLTEKVIGAKEPDSNRETWLIVPNDRFHEIQEYMDKIKEK